MNFPEWKCTFYSGTSVSNFQELAFVSAGSVFYKKVGERFDSLKVYYTSDMLEAIRATLRYTSFPLIMVGRLGVLRRLIPEPKTVPIFPVDSIYIPVKDLYGENLFDGKSRKRDLSQLLEPADMRQFLK